MRLKETAKAYLRSWFLLDSLLVVLGWSVIFFVQFKSLFGIARGFKILRPIRMLRLLRMIRLMKVVNQLPTIPSELMQYVDRDALNASITVVAWVLAMLFLNHLIACGWYGVGTAFKGV